MPVVMGTAGHIDHGKTSLVRALTGMDCDRLSEEKKRGITIELGFAYLELPAGVTAGDRLSIVDMPGHERFVKNMVAGAAGIDFVMLVIAADEGVMPQTREHLEICSLLGIKKGLVALTKIDTVDADWLALVTEDVKNFLKGSFLEEATLYPVSAHTGNGLENLRQALFSMADSFNPKRRSDLPRLPVDRIFTMRGHGTVVTGTLISGNLMVGDELVLLPSGLTAKVRGLQSHGNQVEKAPAGYRTAVNLSRLEVEQINRGEVLTRPACLFPAERWIVGLECLASSPNPLRHRAEVHFHHGAREAQARLYFWDREKLQPGERALCEIRFHEPMVGVFGDRCVIRSFSPLRTVAGGVLLHPLGLPLRKQDPLFAEYTRLLEELYQNPEQEPETVLKAQLRLAGQTGVTFAELCVLANLESNLLDKTLQLLGSKQQVFMIDREERRYIDAEDATLLAESCLNFFAEFHKKEPMKPGVARSALASGWGRKFTPRLVHFILERLLKQGTIVADGEVLRLSTHKISVQGEAADLRSAILKVYAKAGNTPPNLKEVLETLNSTPKEAAPVIKLMQDSAELVKLNEDIYYPASALNEIVQKVLEWFKNNENLGPAELRDLTGLSRKYLIALLEYFDESRLTIRVGDKRVLRLPVV